MRTGLLVLACVLLAACSSGSDSSDSFDSSDGAGPGLPPDPCSAQLAELPEECRVAVSAPASTPAEGSAFWDALRIEDLPGQLAAAGNDVNASLTSATLTARVPAGSRLGVQAACEGSTTLLVTTSPDSAAAVELPCGGGGPQEVGVEEAAPVRAATDYRITVSVPAPARWYAAFYEVSP